ncbi:MAG: hypothetical protein RJA70_4805, partial [Pseudomonadota bacterium]
PFGAKTDDRFDDDDVPSDDDSKLADEDAGQLSGSGLDASVALPDAAVDGVHPGDGTTPPPFGDIKVTRADAATPPPPECDPRAKWKTGKTPPELSGVVTNAVFDVTPNGEHWLVGMTEGAEEQLVLFDFPGAGTVVPLPDGYSTEHGAALSADARTLVLSRVDGRGFGSATRDAALGAFGSVSATPFQELNDLATQRLVKLSNPALNNAGTRFYYTQTAVGSDLFQARLTSGRFEPQEQLNTDFLSGDSHFKVLSDLSDDELTLLYWDERPERSASAWRSTVSLPFLDPTTLSTQTEEQVLDPHLGGSCTTLYYRNTAGALFVAKLNTK